MSDRDITESDVGTIVADTPGSLVAVKLVARGSGGGRLVLRDTVAPEHFLNGQIIVIAIDSTAIVDADHVSEDNAHYGFAITSLIGAAIPFSALAVDSVPTGRAAPARGQESSRSHSRSAWEAFGHAKAMLAAARAMPA
jgi:hypothetical protein